MERCRRRSLVAAVRKINSVLPARLPSVINSLFALNLPNVVLQTSPLRPVCFDCIEVRSFLLKK